MLPPSGSHLLYCSLCSNSAPIICSYFRVWNTAPVPCSSCRTTPPDYKDARIIRIEDSPSVTALPFLSRFGLAVNVKKFAHGPIQLRLPLPDQGVDHHATGIPLVRRGVSSAV
jgi:hypothetical protein